MKQLSTLAVLLACLVLPGLHATAASPGAASSELLAFDQVRAISGTVTDENGSPVIGATVTVVSRSTSQIITGVYTDASGNFTLQLSNPSAVTVRISYIGYTDVVIPGDADDSAFNVALEIGVTGTDEVVVTGYGAQSARDIVGSVDIVDGDDIAATPVATFTGALGGRSTGLAVNQTSGVIGQPAIIRIRGTNSISTNSSPLIVIDGIVVPQGNQGGIYNTQYDALASLNPQDVESYVVLKDAASTAQYGSRGANGVILITTKRGKSGKPKVTLNVAAGTTNRVRELDVLDADQFVQVHNQSVANAAALGVNFNTVASVGTDANGRIETDWDDVIYRNGFQHEYNLAVEGGSQTSSYRGSVSYLDQEGILEKNRLQRISGRFTYDFQATNWLRMGINFSGIYSFIESPRPGGNFGISNSARLAFLLPPNERDLNPDGTLNVGGGSSGAPGNTAIGIFNTTGVGFPFYNPLGDLTYSRFENTIVNIRPSAYFELKPVEWLTFRSQIGYDYTTAYDDTYHNPFHGDFQFLNGLVTSFTGITSTYTFTNTLGFNKTFADKHRVGALVGTEFYSLNTTGNGAQAFNTTNTFQNFADTWTDIFLLPGNYTQQGLISYFGNLSYTFNDKYTLAVNARTDGWSGFSEGNKWGTFYGVAAAWEIGKEDFFANALGNVFQSFTIKASYGETGRLPGNPYASQTVFGPLQYGATGGLGVSTGAVNDANLQWEEVANTNIGIAFTTLNNRVTVTAEYFINNNTELITGVPVAPSLGIPGDVISTNFAEMDNKGIEIGVEALVLKTSWGLQWRSSLNFSTLQNEVISTNPAGDDIIAGPAVNQLARPGEPIGIFQIYDWIGVNPANGRAQFRRADGSIAEYAPEANGFVDQSGNFIGANLPASDRIVTGNPNPTWYGGWGNTLTYGNWEFSVFLTFAGGNQIYNQSRNDLLRFSYANKSTDILNAWSEAGQNTDIPQLFYNRNGWRTGSTQWLEDGDFLNFQNISLAYTLPQDLVRNTLGLSSVRVYGTVQNAFLITGYSGVNPEASSGGDNNIGRGNDLIEVPLARQIQFGLTVGF